MQYGKPPRLRSSRSHLKPPHRLIRPSMLAREHRSRHPAVHRRCPLTLLPVIHPLPMQQHHHRLVIHRLVMVIPRQAIHRLVTRRQVTRRQVTRRQVTRRQVTHSQVTHSQVTLWQDTHRWATRKQVIHRRVIHQIPTVIRPVPMGPVPMVPMLMPLGICVKALCFLRRCLEQRQDNPRWSAVVILTKVIHLERYPLLPPAMDTQRAVMVLRKWRATRWEYRPTLRTSGEERRCRSTATESRPVATEIDLKRCMATAQLTSYKFFYTSIEFFASGGLVAFEAGHFGSSRILS